MEQGKFDGASDRQAPTPDDQGFSSLELSGALVGPASGKVVMPD